jgi:hypothetical protein
VARWEICDFGFGRRSLFRSRDGRRRSGAGVQSVHEMDADRGSLHTYDYIRLGYYFCSTWPVNALSHVIGEAAPYPRFRERFAPGAGAGSRSSSGSHCAISRQTPPTVRRPMKSDRWRPGAMRVLTRVFAGTATWPRLPAAATPPCRRRRGGRRSGRGPRMSPLIAKYGPNRQ